MIRNVLLVLLLASAAVGGTWAAEVELSKNAWNPDVDGRYIVWEDHGGAVSRIALHDTRNGTTVKIHPPARSTNQIEPAISGGMIVFVSVEETAGDDRYEVCLHSISDGTTKVIRSNGNVVSEPDVHATRDRVAVVWTEYVQNDPYGAPNSEIWLYTINVGGTLPVSPKVSQVSDGLYESDPRIDRDWIVWMHKTETPGLDSYHGPYDVYARTVRSGTPVLVSTTTAGERNTCPDVSNDRAVWMAAQEIDGYGSRVLSSSLPPGAGEPVVLEPAGSGPSGGATGYGDPALSGDTLVYVYRDYVSGEHRVMLAGLVNGDEYGLSADAVVEYFPVRFDGSTVVWVDGRSGTWDVYMAATGSTPVTGCTVIDAPGYYAVANDILDSACPVAIDVMCSDVLLDGQGHLVDGLDTAGTAGIRVQGSDTAPIARVAVRDVRLTDWGTGFSGTYCSDSALSNLSATSGGQGISLWMECHENALANCTASWNSDSGIDLGDDCGLAMTGCTVEENDAGGVIAGEAWIECLGSRIAGNGAGYYGGGGFEFWHAGGDIQDTVVSNNQGAGILFFGDSAGFGATITGCSITGNVAQRARAPLFAGQADHQPGHVQPGNLGVVGYSA